MWMYYSHYPLYHWYYCSIHFTREEEGLERRKICQKGGTEKLRGSLLWITLYSLIFNTKYKSSLSSSQVSRRLRPFLLPLEDEGVFRIHLMTLSVLPNSWFYQTLDMRPIRKGLFILPSFLLYWYLLTSPVLTYFWKSYCRYNKTAEICQSRCELDKSYSCRTNLRASSQPDKSLRTEAPPPSDHPPTMNTCYFQGDWPQGRRKGAAYVVIAE